MLTSNDMPFAMSSPVVHRVPELPSSAALGVVPVTDEEATQLARDSAVSPELPLLAPLVDPLLVPLAELPLEAPLVDPLLDPLPPPPPTLPGMAYAVSSLPLSPI